MSSFLLETCSSLVVSCTSLSERVVLLDNKYEQAFGHCQIMEHVVFAVVFWLTLFHVLTVKYFSV
jgi:hypothetical protein